MRAKKVERLPLEGRGRARKATRLIQELSEKFL